MGDYSTYFSHHELYDADDVPGVIEQRNLRLLAKGILDPLRVRNGGQLGVTKTQSGTNGYVGRERNRRRGGSPKSEHCTGRGADVHDIEGRHSPEDLFYLAATLPPIKVELPGGSKELVRVGGLGLYADQGCLHVDIRPLVNGCITIWYRDRGQYLDIPLRISRRLAELGVRWVG
jgi:hypothetical protein